MLLSMSLTEPSKRTSTFHLPATSVKHDFKSFTPNWYSIPTLKDYPYHLQAILVGRGWTHDMLLQYM